MEVERLVSAVINEVVALAADDTAVERVAISVESAVEMAVSTVVSDPAMLVALAATDATVEIRAVISVESVFKMANSANVGAEALLNTMDPSDVGGASIVKFKRIAATMLLYVANRRPVTEPAAVNFK
jgi:hypothetical protein